MKKKPLVIQVVVTEGMREVIEHRASINRRSLSQEALFLLETALALKNEAMRDALQTLYKVCSPDPTPTA